MIIKAFRDFLLSTEELEDPERDKGRVAFQNIVRWRIYDGRVPRSRGGPVAVTLSQQSEIIHNGLETQLTMIGSMVDIDIWAKDTEDILAAERSRTCVRALQQMLIKYRGPLNDDVSVQNIIHEGGPNELPVRPIDASGSWTFRYSITYMLAAEIHVATGVH